MMERIVVLAMLLITMILGFNGQTMDDLFRLSGFVQSGLGAPDICKSWGFDGIGLLTSPEEFNYVLILTKYARKRYAGVWVDFDSTLLYDAPQTETNQPCILLDQKGNFKSLWCGYERQFICGYHKKVLREARGSTHHAMMPANVTRNRSLYQAASHLACTTRCSTDGRCRTAWFNATSQTCTLFNTGDYSGLLNETSAVTFVREGCQRE